MKLQSPIQKATTANPKNRPASPYRQTNKQESKSHSSPSGRLGGAFSSSIAGRLGEASASLAWQIAYTALWNTKEFSTYEKQQEINLITDLLQKENNAKKVFNSFVQRVLLARQYINTHPGTYAPIPTVWLCSTNKNGFAGTQKWLVAVQNIRASIPGYKQPLKVFAEAVHKTATSTSRADFHYWRSYFIQQDAQGLLNLFLSTIANITHSNDCHFEARPIS